MKVQKHILAVAIFFTSSLLIAQKGTIRGTVIEDATGDTMIGVTVVIKGTTTGAVTDFEGNFEISAEPGTYDIQVSFVSFQPIVITGLVVKEDEVTVIDVIRMKEAISELGEVVVTAEAIRTTEEAILTVKRKSPNLLDGISSASFKKIGASNAASAVKRVPGVSVQGGKYVFVRGLGDRYTKTTLNNMEVPGLDPDRNTIQMDLFPTNIIDNIVVFKSFTADLPADFTGGIVDIETKDFPEEKVSSASVSIGFNPSMHFNNTYLDYDGGKTDFLGFDDGKRDIPVLSSEDIPRRIENPLSASRQDRLTEITKSFNPTMAAVAQTSKPNINLGFSTGNQFSREKFTIGYNASLSYRNITTHFEDAVEGTLYTKSSDFSKNELELDRSQQGVASTNNSLLGGLAGLALKTDNTKIKLNLMHIQNGESYSNLYDQRNFLGNSNRSIRHSVGFTERAITNILLSGDHSLSEGIWNVSWKLTPTFSKINDKDVRLTPFSIDGGSVSIEPSEGGNPIRLWRFLDEANYSGKVDLTRKFKLNELSSKLRFGFSSIYKERAFSIENFNILLRNDDELNLNGDPNSILITDNVWTRQSGRGSFIEASYQPSNTYESSINNTAFYVSGELALNEKLKSNIGIRAENYVQRYTGVDQAFASGDPAGRSLDNEKVLDSFKFFPTVNLVYNVIENSNLRLSYAKTIARPSFKEKSIAQILDPISNTTWIGNIDLVESDINNFDLRWEYFFKRGQTVAVSGFYKTFENPIEIVVFGENTPNNFTARNGGDAEVLGVELELRKSLDFISPSLSHFSFNANASFIESVLKMDRSANGEFESKVRNAREGEEVDGTREMQGQSPYLINFSLGYNSFENGWEMGVYYNVQGSTLARVGVGESPDLYTKPFNSLNTTIKKNFGENEKSSVSFRVANILNDKIERVFQSFGAQDQVSSSRSLGRTFTLNYRYTF